MSLDRARRLQVFDHTFNKNASDDHGVRSHSMFRELASDFVGFGKDPCRWITITERWRSKTRYKPLDDR